MRAETPEQAIELFSRCLNTGDFDGALSLYEPDAAFVPQPGVVLTGLDAIREALAGFVALEPAITGRIAKVIRAGDTALVTNAWKLTGTQPDGQAIALEGLSSDVVRQQPDGRWLVVIDDPWGSTPG